MHAQTSQDVINSVVFVLRSPVKVPLFVDLSRPDKILNHTTNLYLPTEEGVSVGVWSVTSRSPLASSRAA